MIKKVINVSGKAGAGKDTFANMVQKILEEQGKTVMRISYADYLKYICTKLFAWDGKKDEKGRTLLQKVGTDIVREQDPDFWVRNVCELAQLFDSFYDYVICADCRFPNEDEYWQQLGFDTCSVKIIRPKYETTLDKEQLAHSSENSMETYNFDWQIINDTLDGLEVSVEIFVLELLEEEKAKNER